MYYYHFLATGKGLVSKLRHFFIGYPSQRQDGRVRIWTQILKFQIPCWAVFSMRLIFCHLIDSPHPPKTCDHNNPTSSYSLHHSLSAVLTGFSISCQDCYNSPQSLPSCCGLDSESRLPLWQPCGLLPTRFLCPWDFPSKGTGVGCHFLLQGIFPSQGLNPGLLHCRQTLYGLSHQGSLHKPRGALRPRGLRRSVWEPEKACSVCGTWLLGGSALSMCKWGFRVELIFV